MVKYGFFRLAKSPRAVSHLLPYSLVKELQTASVYRTLLSGLAVGVVVHRRGLLLPFPVMPEVKGFGLRLTQQILKSPTKSRKIRGRTNFLFTDFRKTRNPFTSNYCTKANVKRRKLIISPLFNIFNIFKYMLKYMYSSSNSKSNSIYVSSKRICSSML